MKGQGFFQTKRENNIQGNNQNLLHLYMYSESDGDWRMSGVCRGRDLFKSPTDSADAYDIEFFASGYLFKFVLSYILCSSLFRQIVILTSK